MKILGDVISPFTRMCLVTAHELGLKDKVQLVVVHTKPHQVNQQMEKLSALGKMPILETDHGHPIYDSRVIMEYIAHVAGASDFIPNDGVARFRVLTLLALAQGMADAGVALRYETAARPEESRWPELAERLRARINAAVAEFESHADQLVGVNAATIAAACALAYIDLRHGAAINWRASNPKTAAFAQAFNERQSMKDWPLG
jgi:glutathione S-transferase